MFDFATGWLRGQRRVLLPGATTVERDVASVRDQAERKLWHTIAKTLDNEQRERLERLMNGPYGASVSALERLRRAPVSVSAQGLLGALTRLREIRAVGCRRDPHCRLAGQSGRGTRALRLDRESPGDRPADRRPAGRHTAGDHSAARGRRARQRARSLRSAARQAPGPRQARPRQRALPITGPAGPRRRQLREAALVLTDGDYEDVASLRAAVFELVPREQLLQAARTADELARPSEDTEAEQLLSRYAFVRKFLPPVLDTITFQAAPAGEPILDAIDALRRIEHRRKVDPAEVPLGLLGARWQQLAVGADGVLDKRAYTLGVLEQLRFALRRRDVFASGSERWSDPRRRLLEGTAWQQARPVVSHPGTFIECAPSMLTPDLLQRMRARREVEPRFTVDHY